MKRYKIGDAVKVGDGWFAHRKGDHGTIIDIIDPTNYDTYRVWWQQAECCDVIYSGYLELYSDPNEPQRLERYLTGKK